MMRFGMAKPNRTIVWEEQPSDDKSTEAYKILQRMESIDPYAELTSESMMYDEPPLPRKQQLLKEWKELIEKLTGTKIKEIQEAWRGGQQ